MKNYNKISININKKFIDLIFLTTAKYNILFIILSII